MYIYMYILCIISINCPGEEKRKRDEIDPWNLSRSLEMCK